jgi:hypothetical protein
MAWHRRFLEMLLEAVADTESTAEATVTELRPSPEKGEGALRPKAQDVADALRARR